MAETITAVGFAENRNTSDSKASKLPILKEESEVFGDRLKSVIGQQSLRAFGRRTEISDGLLGAYIRSEKLPGLDNLISIANAAGVTVDWLAMGRLPKYRSEQRYAISQAQPMAMMQEQAAYAVNGPGEAELLETYRQAPEAGRNALDKVATAIRTQTMGAWFSAGQAISEAANVFDRKK